MEPIKPKISVKDFFLNLGATIALYTVVISLINLLFTVINNAYPKITNAYYYAGTSSISWPVAVLVIFTPILILLMWLLEKQYMIEPERKDSGIHK
jgi:type II secretory pathway component PulF